MPTGESTKMGRLLSSKQQNRLANTSPLNMPMMENYCKWTVPCLFNGGYPSCICHHHNHIRVESHPSPFCLSLARSLCPCWYNHEPQRVVVVFGQLIPLHCYVTRQIVRKGKYPKFAIHFRSMNYNIYIYDNYIIQWYDSFLGGMWRWLGTGHTS